MKLTIIKQSLPAHTLMETIVASTILLIVFVIAMHALTQLTKADSINGNDMEMELDLQRVRKGLVLEDGFAAEQQYTYDWGKINVHISPYDGRVYQVKMEAVTTHTKREISYRFLLAAPTRKMTH